MMLLKDGEHIAFDSMHSEIDQYSRVQDTSSLKKPLPKTTVTPPPNGILRCRLCCIIPIYMTNNFNKGWR